MTRERKFIYSSAAFLLLCLIFLSWYGNIKMNKDYEGNWWAIYFDTANKGSLSFDVENHSKTQQFTWEIYQGKDQLENGSINLPIGSQKKIEPNINPIKGLKYMIKVTDNSGSKEIYKQY